MQCYLINLDRAPERLSRMEKILSEKGILFERVAALDGKTLSSQEVAEFRKETLPGKGMNLGDIACGASHISALQRIAEREDEFAIVMEDDLHLSEDISFFVRDWAWIPENADIIKMETFAQKTFVDRRGIKLGCDRQLVRLRSDHWGTAFYIIRKGAAERVLSQFSPGLMCIDQYVFGEALQQFCVYQVDPAPAIQDTTTGMQTSSFLATSIMLDRMKSPKIRGFSKVVREIRRVGRKIYSAGYIVRAFIVRGQVRKIIPFRK